MTDTTEPQAHERPTVSSIVAQAAGRPDGLPDKFWDDDAGGVRTDALLKAYLDLERHLGTGEPARQAIPVNAEDYRIKEPHPMVAADPDLNARLHQAGFSQEQAQLVYDLAAEHLLPMITEIGGWMAQHGEAERLARHFGGGETWRTLSRQIADWGKANFPETVFNALASSYDGVIAMHRMMVNGTDEPALVTGGVTGGEALNEASLRNMMQDPRYWREQDPAFVKRVKDGFARLYPDDD